MDFLLPCLSTKKEVDDALRNTQDKVVVLRFGKASDQSTLVVDSVLEKAVALLSNMATIYAIDVNTVPVYAEYFDVTITPATVFFFNGQHIKVDYGTPDHTKFIGVFRDKEDFIDLVEVIFRGAMKGKLIVKSPLELNRVDRYDLFYKEI